MKINRFKNVSYTHLYIIGLFCNFEQGYTESFLQCTLYFTLVAYKINDIQLIIQKRCENGQLKVPWLGESTLKFKMLNDKG